MGIVLGVDPGIVATGWGVVDIASSRRIVLLGCGVIRRGKGTESKTDAMIRISDAVVQILEKFSPDFAVVEDSFVNMNPRSSLVLGQVRGVILLSLGKGGIKVLECSPTYVKKSVTGNGHASKEQVMFMVKKIVKNVPDDITKDACDAIAAALSYSNYC